ncbi:putative ankyrin-like protein [Oryza sativa Japonica Group]|uniref:Putative ankyrin-like protein n=1 Tax=Oryza sativa subsp. japonica TaxID=39947 RepID=Q5VQZ8_ORYSJ|nr:putative ankyrin-like protein [Oryza sativa Japonica Group]
MQAIVYLTSSSCSLIHVIQFTDLVLVSPDLLAAELPARGHRLGGSSSSLCCRARRRMCLPQRYWLEVVASLSLGGSDVLPVDVDGGVWCREEEESIKEDEESWPFRRNQPNVIINNGAGSPLMSSLIYRSLKCMKLLIKAGADVNGKGTVVTPLMLAASQGGYTNFIQFLLKAGANPNIPDDLGWLPIEHAALRDCREEVEMLFPLTSPIPNVPNWSVNGIIAHAKVKNTKPMDQHQKESRKVVLKAQADLVFKQKNYAAAAKIYDLAIAHGPTAVLYANRSICRLLMGDGEGALSDAYRCRMMRPNWAKACYRQGAAHMLLKEYKHACDALMDAQKLDSGNVEIERELRKARELMAKPPDEQ